MSLFDELNAVALGIEPESNLPPTRYTEFLQDTALYRSTPMNYQPNPADFTMEALAAQPGMQWLSDCRFHLVAPRYSDASAQMGDLRNFCEGLKQASTYHTKETLRNNQFIADYYNSPVIAIDYETTGLDTRLRFDYDGSILNRTKIVGVVIAVSAFESYYLPFRHTEEDGVPNWSNEVLVEFLELLNDNFSVIFHNGMYDREVATLAGVKNHRSFPYYFDTQILDYMIDVDRKVHGLKHISGLHLGRKMIKINSLFNNSDAAKADEGSIEFEKLSASVAMVYACSDGANTYALWDFFRQLDGPTSPFLNQPLPLVLDHNTSDTVRSLTRMGLPVNLRFNFYAAKDAMYRLHQIEQAIYATAGKQFNIGSSPQLASVLFEQFHIPPLGDNYKTPTGGYSLNEDALDELFRLNPDFPILQYVVTYRKVQANLSKIYFNMLLNSYTDAAVPFARGKLGFSITNVPTGRFSSSSSGSKERVTARFGKETAKGQSVKFKYERGEWDIGLNSQGFPSFYYSTAPAKQVTSLPPEAGIDFDNLYGDIERDFMKQAASY